MAARGAGGAVQEPQGLTTWVPGGGRGCHSRPVVHKALSKVWVAWPVPPRPTCQPSAFRCLPGCPTTCPGPGSSCWNVPGKRPFCSRRARDAYACVYASTMRVCTYARIRVFTCVFIARAQRTCVCTCDTRACVYVCRMHACECVNASTTPHPLSLPSALPLAPGPSPPQAAPDLLSVTTDPQLGQHSYISCGRRPPRRVFFPAWLLSRGQRPPCSCGMALAAWE